MKTYSNVQWTAIHLVLGVSFPAFDTEPNFRFLAMVTNKGRPMVEGALVGTGPGLT